MFRDKKMRNKKKKLISLKDNGGKLNYPTPPKSLCSLNRGAADNTYRRRCNTLWHFLKDKREKLYLRVNSLSHALLGAADYKLLRTSS